MNVGRPLPYRIGQIVPSSNTTMETEVPDILRRSEAGPGAFSFHSSRMRMRKVSPEELARMDGEAERCAVELADAQVDVVGYACLIAIMSQGLGYHRKSEAKLSMCMAQQGAVTPVVSSAGALVDSLKLMRASKVSIVTPYMRPLTDLVIGYLESEGITVIDSISLEIDDNLAVGRLDPAGLVPIARKLKTLGADAIVLSACVQMPSLPAVPLVEADLGLPVLTAAIATAHQMLLRLGLNPTVPHCGELLSGRYATCTK